MKIFLALVILAGIYLFVIKKNAKEEPGNGQRPVTAAATATSTPAGRSASSPGTTNSNALKRPLDRTRAVLDQVHDQVQKNKGEF